MHLSYGNQGWYKALGIEPRCGICEHWQDRDGDAGPCNHPTKPLGLVVKRGCCFNFSRAPGADDESIPA